MANGNSPKITPIGSGSWQGIMAEQGAQWTEQSIVESAAVWDSLIGGNRTAAAVSQARNAGDAIRARFYQKEWDQIRKTRIMPIQERMTADEAEYRDRLSVSPRRVETFVGEEEAQIIGETFQPQPGEKIPGKPTADGKPGKETLGPPVPAPNAAINPGTLGAVRTEEVPSIMDPTTGEPVPTSSARALDIMRELSDMYWKRSQDNILEMMDIYGEYSSNPFVSQASQQLMQSVVDASGQSATGKTDPQAQQEWWEDRQRFEADMEAQETTTAQGALQLEESEGRIRAREEFGRAQAADPNFPIRDSIRKRLLTEKPLTRKQSTELASAVDLQHAREKERFELRKAEGLEVIPRALFRNPQDWHGRLSNNDRSYQNYYKDELTNNTNALTQRYIQMFSDNREGLEAFMIKNRAPRDLIEMAMASQWDDPGLVSWISLKANTEDARQEAHDSAFLKRLPEISRSQPGVAEAIIEELTEVLIPDAWNGRVIDGGTGKPIVMTKEIEEQWLADPYVTFFLSTHGRNPPVGYQRDPIIRERLNKVKVKQRERAAYREAQSTPPGLLEPMSVVEPPISGSRQRLEVLSPNRALDPLLEFASPEEELGMGLGRSIKEIIQTPTLEQARGLYGPPTTGSNALVIKEWQKVLTGVKDVTRVPARFIHGLGRGLGLTADEEKEALDKERIRRGEMR